MAKVEPAWCGRGQNAVIQLQILRETVRVIFQAESIRDALRPLMESFYSAITLAGPVLCKSVFLSLIRSMTLYCKWRLSLLPVIVLPHKATTLLVRTAQDHNVHPFSLIAEMNKMGGKQTSLKFF
jgi:hypothetical protein